MVFCSYVVVYVVFLGLITRKDGYSSDLWLLINVIAFIFVLRKEPRVHVSLLLLL